MIQRLAIKGISGFSPDLSSGGSFCSSHLGHSHGTMKNNWEVFLHFEHPCRIVFAAHWMRLSSPIFDVWFRLYAQVGIVWFSHPDHMQCAWQKLVHSSLQFKSMQGKPPTSRFPKIKKTIQISGFDCFCCNWSYIPESNEKKTFWEKQKDFLSQNINKQLSMELRKILPCVWSPRYI